MRKLFFAKGLRLLCFVAGVLYGNTLIAGGYLLQPDGSAGHYSVRWLDTQIPIKWYLSEDGLPGSGISNTELAALLQTSFTTWSDIPASRISFEYMGELSERLSGIDGKNLITFTDHDYVFPENELAFTIIYNFTQETIVDATNSDLDDDGVDDLPYGTYPAGTIYEADIVFNASYPLADSVDSSTVDIRAVALHEIGHFSGLSHSILPDAVMHPFLSLDLSSSRILKADDIAFASSLYPDPSYATTFGSVSGFISNGFGGQAVLGAHVYAVEPMTGIKTVGAFSLEQGDYQIPGLVPGNYYIGIEPLDGDPIEADPMRINEVIKNTFDTNFTPEFYDTNESNIETSPDNAQVVNVAGAGASVTNIDLVTNTIDVPGVGFTLHAGLNLFSYPVNTSTGFTAKDLLQEIGDPSEINSIDRYNSSTGRYVRMQWVDGEPDGIDFDIQRGEAYLVHMKLQKTLAFKGQQDCPLVNTKKGFNLIGVPCPPAGYSAYDLLGSIGPGVISVQRYNTETQSLETASLDSAGQPTGEDFVIANGVGYVVNTQADRTGVSLPGLGQIFPPFISGLSPGRAVIGAQVMIIGQGFSDDVTKNDVIFNGVRAAVNYAAGDQLVVTVPSGASTGEVTVSTSGKTSNAMDFVVESSLVNEADLQGKDMIDGQSVQGNLDSNSEQDRYSFIVSKGASISATAISNTGVPDIWLYLEGPSGEVLAKDEDSSDGANAKISRFVAGRTGRYTLVVTARPGSGSGGYTLSLNIENTPPVAEIAVLSGDYQTGLKGTQLPIPLEVLVTGTSGQPVSGASVAIITNDSDNINVTTGYTAATYQVLTNSSGIVTINMTLPNTPGIYYITIDVAGYGSKTIKASSVASLPVVVEVIGSGQDCGGGGCPVDQPLPNPYKLRFLDAGGLPVPGVLTKFTVASGDGELIPSTNITTEFETTSDSAGEVAVTHKLGKKVFDVAGNRIPQIVAATGTNPGAELWLFEPIAMAGTPTTINSLKSSSIQLTMGTAVLNAIQIKVTDGFGNPAANTDLTATTTGGLEVFSVIDGVFSSILKTDGNGEFIGALVAGFTGEALPYEHAANAHKQTPHGSYPPNPGITQAHFGISGVSPTKDEFGANIQGALPYSINILAGGIQFVFSVDVDMGPRLVAISDDTTAKQYDAQWVGKVMEKPVTMKIVSYQRTDECGTPPNGSPTFFNDDDLGYWGDEDFSIHRLRSWSYIDIYFTYITNRTDGANDTSKLILDLENIDDVYDEVTVSTLYEEGSLEAPGLFGTYSDPVYILMGDVRGDIMISAKTKPQWFFIDADELCFNGSDLYYIGNQFVDPIFEAPVNWGIWTIPTLHNSVQLRAASPPIVINVDDSSSVEPPSDPLQILRSNSGVDLTKLKIRLNGNFIFDGSSSVLQIGQFPNYVEAKIDGASLTEISNNVLQSFSPQQFEFVYYSTADELNLTTDNLVEITNIVDRAGNVGADQSRSFILP